jgi:hypothetical protein
VCLEEISVAEVFEQAQRLLAREVAEREATTPAG